AAAEIADQVQGRYRRTIGLADRRQHTGQRDVVDVVPGDMGDRPVLTPAGHPAVDQPRVTLEADVRAEAEALHDSRAKPLDQRISLVDEAQRRLDAVLVLQID